MNNILVVCQDYPDDAHPYKMAWAHTRNVFYQSAGLSTTVCSFSATSGYTFQSLPVVPGSMLTRDFVSKFDLVALHSPNMRNHLWALRGIRSVPFVVFCHGTESLYVNKDYPEPYPFMRQSVLSRVIRDAYDMLKMKVLKRFILNRKDRAVVVFVSEWMRDKFFANVGNLDELGVTYHIIHNPLWTDFLSRNYRDEAASAPSADFVTLRRLDFSKYAVDQVCSLAEHNPQYSFHLVGTGDYFKHYAKPGNLTLINKHIPQSGLADFLSDYRCALMPTRVDAQGVMVCEMAVFGMPVITSDAPVCHEMLEGFPNVKFLPSGLFASRLADSDFPPSAGPHSAPPRFTSENTVQKEVALFQNLLKGRT